MARAPAPADLAEPEIARSQAVRARLTAAAGPSGFLRFDRFVEIALYAPGIGYYAHPGVRRGQSGDYYTAPHVHPMFGATLARRVRREFDRLGRPRSFRVVEVGSGDGTLSRDLRSEWARAGAGAALEYVRIDRAGDAGSPSPEDEALPGSLRFGRSLTEEGPMFGVVLANELLDAFPFRRLLRRDGRWVELGVAVEGDSFRWEEAEVAERVPPPALSEAPDGTILEISPPAEAWLRELADTLTAGVALILDYGADESELVARKPGGTLQAVRGHRASVGPLERPGTADLSAWLNFSRLRAAARRAGLAEIAYRSQAEALGDWGFEEVRREREAAASTPEEKVRIHLAAKSLLFGFERFRVLELAARGGPIVT